MKTTKKFSTSCFSVENKKRNIMANCMPLFVFVVILWLIPSALKNNIKSAFSYVQTPISKTTILFENIKNKIKTKSLSKAELTKFCEDLIRQNSLLEMEIDYLTNEKQIEAEETYKICNFTAKNARVIRRDIETWANELNINLGARDGISAGMGVISKNHVIGRIKFVAEKFSTVELITSPQFRIACHATTDETFTPIIFSGKKYNSVTNTVGEATNIPSGILDEDLSATLATSSLSGIFPSRIIIGKVKLKTAPDDNNFSSDVLLDSDLLSKLYEVTVLINTEQ